MLQARFSKFSMLLAAGAVCAAFAPGEAAAGTYQVTFTATNFVPFTGLGGSVPSPIDQISGSFTYLAASEFDPILSLSSVSLVIDGHSYDVSELAFNNDPVAPFSAVGKGSGCSPGFCVNSHTDEWAITWLRGMPTAQVFSYALPSTPSAVWNSFDVSLVTAAVPEPNAAAMLALGGLIVGLWARRPRREA